MDPLDDRYGKRAGELAGEGIGFLLPFRYVKIGSPTWLGKLSPTAVRTTTSGAIYSSASELSDAATDFRQDGSQNVGKRLGNVAMDSALAGAGDIAGHAGGRIVSGVLKKINVKPVAEPNFNTPGTKPIVAASPQEQVGFAKVEGLRGIAGTGDLVDDLLKTSRCNTDELTVYLKKMDAYNGTNYADEFASLGKWPDEIQIPKDRSVLNADGSIKWSEVPNGGYVLDRNGNAIKDVFVPKTGDIIDRYGPPNGRYTSPVLDGKPYNYDQRSLPYVEDVTKYYQYEVIGDFNDLKIYIQQCPDVNVRLKAEAYMKKFKISFDELKVQKGNIAEGFGSSGGGIQFELPLPVNMLEDLGLLVKVN
ncbi:hypothetical protein CGZ75_24235 [Paenibacillus herberti]|uniref:TNT domain-containing protein n=1 Tax=Paenibacillus herberti TaxID=1619309 RepID=A0A229NSX4_9BACL|nr:hypothetical protein CGZ75_24235 [Paenibacillus herberti]